MWKFEKSLLSTLWTSGTNRRSKMDAIEMQEGRALVRSHSTPENSLQAHRACYLGHLTVSEATGTGCTEKPVLYLLNKATQENTDLEYIYIDVQPNGIVYYHVDHNSKVTGKKWFNISRISYCSGDHKVDRCIFAWIYHQETGTGKGLECHVVRMRSERKAKVLALQLHQAFHTIFNEVQAALESSRMFKAAITKLQSKDVKNTENDDDNDSNVTEAQVVTISLPSPNLMTLPVGSGHQ